MFNVNVVVRSTTLHIDVTLIHYSELMHLQNEFCEKTNKYMISPINCV
jgi:hypothetical protein